MSFSEEEYSQLCNNFGLDPVTGKLPKAHKYGARKKEVDGIVFDSSAEARRYIELKAMQAAGVISELKLQPPFLLQKSFSDRFGGRHRAIWYFADFDYLENGRRIVEDVKGWGTPAWKIKWKWAIRLYPDVEFRKVKR